jgi:hypothetical protein
MNSFSIIFVTTPSFANVLVFEKFFKYSEKGIFLFWDNKNEIQCKPQNKLLSF